VRIAWRETRASTAKFLFVILAVAAGIALTLVFLAMFLGMTGCGGGHTGPFGQWTITTVATGAGAPHGANITLTITP